MASVEEIPAGEAIETVVVYGDSLKGAFRKCDHGEWEDKFAVFSRWGEVLRQYHGKDTEERHTDVVTNYLGYWMDNGAFYYYNTLPNMTYQVVEAFQKEIEKEYLGIESNLMLISSPYFKRTLYGGKNALTQIWVVG